MGWFSMTLAETRYIAMDGDMRWAKIDFNSSKDFRDVNVSQGWLSVDFETVAVHEIGHVAGIHGHAATVGSPMNAKISVNVVDRTLNSHDIAAIGGMY